MPYPTKDGGSLKDEQGFNRLGRTEHPRQKNRHRKRGGGQVMYKQCICSLSKGGWQVAPRNCVPEA